MSAAFKELEWVKNEIGRQLLASKASAVEAHHRGESHAKISHDHAINILNGLLAVCDEAIARCES